MVRATSCPPTANFEKDGYTVRSSRVDEPFSYLHWVFQKEQAVSTGLAALLDGKPFHYNTAIDQALQQIENEQFLQDTSDARIKISLEFVSVENCDGKSLDLAYRVYSTQIPPILSGTPESRRTEDTAPQKVAGFFQGGIPVHFIPVGGYNASEKLLGGGRFEFLPKRFPTGLPFNSLVTQGVSSPSMRSVSISLSGFTDSQGWLAHQSWLLNYANSSLPANRNQLKQGELSAEYSATTKSFSGGNLIGRFGALVDGGNSHGTTAPANLAPNTIPGAGYGVVRLFAGLDSRLQHNVFSVSYGLELGSVAPGIHLDWKKQVGDITHEFWYPAGDHRIFELESRLTAGGIQTPGKIPLPARFFGGNTEDSFTNNDSWKIRSNPVIRAIPANRFNMTSQGAGADSFFSYNLTAALAVWKLPLVPSELARDAQFRSLLNGQITTATSIEQIYYAAKDPHFSNLVADIPGVLNSLGTLKSAVLASQTAHPDRLAAEFKTCIQATNMANFRAKMAETGGFQQYARISALLSVDPQENRLMKVVQACSILNDQLQDSTIAAALSPVESVRSTMEHEFSLIDQESARAKANDDMAFVRRTLDTLFEETNIYSISPVGVFDVARIGPQQGSFGGWRYGPGAGVRLGLVSTVNFTLGYAWNIRQHPGEGPGAVFFSIDVKDLFH